MQRRLKPKSKRAISSVAEQPDYLSGDRLVTGSIPVSPTLKSDRTYCSGLRCVRINTCERWIGHYKTVPKFPVSIAQFADWDGKCTNYLEFE